MFHIHTLYAEIERSFYACLAPLHFNRDNLGGEVRGGTSLLWLHAGTYIPGFKNLGFGVLQVLCFQNSNSGFSQGDSFFETSLLFFLFFLFSPPCRQPARLQAFLFEGHLQQAQVDVALDSLYFGILWVSKRLCSIKVIRLGDLGREGEAVLLRHTQALK